MALITSLVTIRIKESWRCIRALNRIASRAINMAVSDFGPLPSEAPQGAEDELTCAGCRGA
eukprot:12074325-Karenia_brevis.AAC.1